ncbi:CocE/NonD family hydrolase [Gorillibacterium massiliense]|uniref:CocE/NonD family hydrolase n=1 Tax=Gorillibacterium massiliense TaxID=1280390 RepID=UPI0004B1A880|nr:CocE/NonD family hydrolase [Gorillibacterium massiliense]
MSPINTTNLNPTNPINSIRPNPNINPNNVFRPLRDDPLPPPPNELGPYHVERVKMGDGVHLTTHVWLPEGVGPWPAILVRNPYVDGGYNPDPALVQLARYGFAVVCQECRGRGNSEGEWVPFVNERQDGLDTLAWLKRQPWVNGNIGLYGGSYLSFAQWIVADALPPEVKTMYLCVMGTDQHRFIYMNGMFRPDIYTSWSLTNAGVDWNGADMNEVADRAYWFRPAIEMDREMLGKEVQWYRSFLQNPSPSDPLWNEEPWAQLREMPAKVNVPVCMVGGWHDIAIDMMFDSYRQLRPEVRERSRFVVGPWVHSLAPAGDMTYPNGVVDGSNGGHRAVIEWFNATLKNEPFPEAVGVTDAYVIGGDGWRAWSNWPPESKAVRYYLSEGGKLAAEPPQTAFGAGYVYDPDSPVATVGGSGLLSVFGDSPYLPKAACVKQSPVGWRDDVLSFVSEPIGGDLLIAGTIRIALRVASTAEDTAFTVKISEMLPNGDAYNIADGIATLAYRNGAVSPRQYEPSTEETLDIELWPIAWKVRQGSRLRVDISSSNFPAYPAHPNVFGPWAEQAKTRKAEQTIYGGGAYPSLIELPIAD